MRELISYFYLRTRNFRDAAAYPGNALHLGPFLHLKAHFPHCQQKK